MFSSKTDLEKIDDLRKSLRTSCEYYVRNGYARVNDNLAALGVPRVPVSTEGEVRVPVTAVLVFSFNANDNEGLLAEATKYLEYNKKSSYIEYGKVATLETAGELTVTKPIPGPGDVDPQPEGETYDDFVKRVYAEARALVTSGICSSEIDKVLRHAGLKAMPRRETRYFDVPVTGTSRISVTVFADDTEETALQEAIKYAEKNDLYLRKATVRTEAAPVLVTKH